MPKQVIPNRLWTYRKKKGLSQKRVAFLIAQKNSSQLSHYERGDKRPNLMNALKLEILYRVPVAYLYHELYDKLRDDIQTRESTLKKMLEKE
ncbi:MAG TPA: helix-turn-helix transcriptional regulator [Smithella sp.]|nr:helix-turn-helix transcriptional regulator [Smithella sp.]